MEDQIDYREEILKVIKEEAENAKRDMEYYDSQWRRAAARFSAYQTILAAEEQRKKGRKQND